jgi:predicted DNA-binding transcriptional regulator YafY
LVYRPTARVLTILELLQSHESMTGAELARRLEVDVRTVRNYIQTLIDLGVPVEAERGRYGAYHLRAGYKLPPLIFTEDEALALTLSLLVARQSGLAAAAPAFDGVLAKVERVLPAATRSRIQAVEQTVAFDHDPSNTAPSSLAVMVLSAAIQSGQRVLLHYRSSRSEVTQRAFDPYGIAYSGGLWYTIGYCHLRGGQRLFRVDRITQIEMTSETFPPPINFSALEAVQQALATVPRAWPMEVWLETTLEEAQRQMQLPKTFFEEANGGILFRMDVDDLPWVARQLAGMGVPFIVHRPRELCDVLREYARTLVGYAERDEM